MFTTECTLYRCKHDQHLNVINKLLHFAVHNTLLTSHIFKVSLLNFTVLGKNNFTIGIHGHGWLFPSKLNGKLNVQSTYISTKWEFTAVSHKY